MDFFDWLQELIVREIFSIVFGAIALIVMVAAGHYITKPILWVMDRVGLKNSYIRRKTEDLSGFAIIILIITFGVIMLLDSSIRSGNFKPLIAIGAIGAYFLLVSKIKLR